MDDKYNGWNLWHLKIKKAKKKGRKFWQMSIKKVLKMDENFKSEK